MDNSEFGVHLEQISVREYRGFFFTLPERDVGRSDVKIYVEYGVASEEGKVLFNVWANLKGQSIRALVLRSVVAIEQEDKIIETIMMELNGSDEFFETTVHFIEHFDH